MLLGVIADDFTGGLDAAGFIRKGGLEVTFFSGVPSRDEMDGVPSDAAAVIALQIRSCSPCDAVRAASEAADALIAASCRMIYLKYCSTFDSTPRGNIGPVLDALLSKLGLGSSIAVPSLPVNGRTVRDGILYVNGIPLAQSPMRHHPLNPMTESSVPRLLGAQSCHPAYSISLEHLRRGEAWEEYEGRKGYAVIDAVTDDDISAIASSFSMLPLASGGSALAGAFAHVFSGRERKGVDEGKRLDGRCLMIVGSCSAASVEQVSRYKALGAPVMPLSIERCLSSPGEYIRELLSLAESASPYPLMVSAAKDPEARKALDAAYPDADIASITEDFFASLASAAIKAGFRRMIVGGGETSGAVVRAAGLRAFRIGREIAPGVSWMYSGDIGFALKSGNFGGADFFREALYE